MTGDSRDLVTALLGLPGVAGATVEPVKDGSPGTLRLQLVADADEVEVAAAVNDLLRSRFGLAVDVERVRVVEDGSSLAVRASPGTAGTVAPGVPPQGWTLTDGPDVDGPGADGPDVDKRGGDREPPARATRLTIERVQLVTAEAGVTAAVTLRAGERSEVGEAGGAASADALRRSVAGATLRAVEALVGGRAGFELEHVELAETGTQSTALAVVSMIVDGRAQRLSGASVLRGDERQAVIRAVLAAVNRRVEPMLVDPKSAEQGLAEQGPAEQGQ